MRKQYRDDEYNSIELLADMLQGRGSTKSQSVSKLISARIPIGTIASVDAFAETIGAKRNKALVLILEAGIEAVLEKIDDPETLNDLDNLHGMKIQDLLPEALNEENYDSEG